MNIKISRLFDAYHQYLTQIDNLYQRSHSPNFGYEPKRMQNLLNAFGAAEFDKASVFMAFEGETLMALIPFEPAQINRLSPVKIYKNQLDDMNIIGDPLIDAQNSQAVLAVFGTWLDENKIYFIFNNISTEQAHVNLPLASNLNELLWQFERACIETDLKGDEYYKQNMRASRRKSLRKNRRRLDEMGKVELIALDGVANQVSEADATQWVENFLIIEGAGWKGDKGTSLASDPRTEKYFTNTVKTWFAEQRIMTFELKLDGQTIASALMQIHKSDDQYQAFGIRTAYLEQYHVVAPGILIANYFYTYMMDHYNFVRIDACSVPKSQVANALMTQKFSYSGYAVAPHGGKLLPYVIWLEQKRLALRAALKAKIAAYKALKTT